MNAHLPYTLAHPLEEAYHNIEKGNWLISMNYLLDFMEIGASYASIVLLSLFRKDIIAGNASAGNGVLGAIRKIDVKRPLSFGDWVNDILSPLAVEAAGQFPQNPFVCELIKVTGRKRNIFLPSQRDSGVIQIRNRYKGHGTTLSDSHYEAVVRQLEPKAAQFASAMSTIWQSGVDLKDDLYPLVHTSEQGYEYVFQTLMDEDASFVSTDENALSLTTSELNGCIDRWIQAILPSFDIARNRNWDENVEAMRDVSQAYMADIYAQKKYNREQFVEREMLSAAYREFLASDRILFPLPGEAGQGKTNQLCHWTETLSGNGDAVLIFGGAEFSDVLLENRLKEVFGLSPKKSIEKYLATMNDQASASGKFVHIFFDAINEAITYPGLTTGTSGPLLLYRDIYKIFGEKGLNRFKILFTCRTYTWINQLLPEQAIQDASLFFRPNEEAGAYVKGFSDSEVRKAYSIYGELFQMETPFENLKRGVVLRLKDPLMLKIACTNYLGRVMPEAQEEFTSLSLFSKMMGDISHSYAGRNQVRILNEISHYMLEKYSCGEAVDSILVDDLKAAMGDEGHMLYKASSLMFRNDGITVAFAELLNRPERPILRMAEQGKVQFIYERFLEYLLSQAYMNEHQVVTAEGIFRSIKNAATNEVFMGAMRNVLLMDYLHSGTPETIISLLKTYGDDLEVFSLVSGMLDVLVRELYAREIFDIERHLLSWKEDGQDLLINQFNAVCRDIDERHATDDIISRHKELAQSLTPMIRLRNLAGATLISGILLSDAHNENLYKEDPYTLLWELLDDPLTEVRNNTCMQAYYVSKRTLTLNHEPLKENITQQIVRRMFELLKNRPVPALIAGKRARNRTATILETGVRLDVILMIDLLLDEDINQRGRVLELLEEVRALIKHLTLNYSLIRLLMPFFTWILRRQVTFQSDYVNNLTEYTTFWDDSIVASRPEADNRWNRSDVTQIAPMVFLYSRYHTLKNGTAAPPVAPFTERICAAYHTGDSLSYFLLERILVIFGLSDWDATLPILKGIDSSIKDTEWFDYSQMSFVYVLYQLGLKMKELPVEVEEMLNRNCADWTRRCRGYFKGHNSALANPLQLYKRNVMSWYAMVWCARYGDRPDGTGQSVPLFRLLLEEAIAARDKELLVHLINNIAELVTDSGDIYTALDLLKVIFGAIPSQEALDEFDENAAERYPDTAVDPVKLIGNILGVAKNYFPVQVNDFLTKGVLGMTFPGLTKYKDDILSYNPSGEKLSDLLTHKFGNFIIWALIYEESVDEVVEKCLVEAANSHDSAEWFNRCVRIVLSALLKVRI